MNARQPRTPGPDHPITLTPNPARVLVRVAGTLGQRDDHDLGWIAELAIPFADLGLNGPPAPNEQWRMNLYRIERGEVEEFTAWSPTLKSPADFHVPSRFGTLVFVEE